MIQDKNLKEILRDGGISLFIKIVGIGFTYAFYFFVAKLFGEGSLGIFSIFWTFLMIFSVLGKAGFDSSLVKYISAARTEKHFSKVRSLYIFGIRCTVLCGLILSAILWITAEWFSEMFFDTAKGVIYIRILAIILPFSIATGINGESLKSMKKVIPFSLFQNGGFFTVASVILLISILFSLTVSPVYAIAIAVCLAGMVSFIPVHKTILSLHTEHEVLEKKKILRTSFPMLLSNSVFLVLTWTDTLMLGHYEQDTMVGYYTAALKIAALNTIPLVVINSIAMPKYAELFAQNDISSFKKFVKQISTVNFIISLPIILPIVVFPDFFMQLFGEGFEKASLCLIILASGNFFSSISGSTINILNMTGKQNTARNILLIAGALNIILNFVLVPVYSILGSAAATAFTTVLWNVLAIIYIYKYYGFLSFPGFRLKN